MSRQHLDSYCTRAVICLFPPPFPSWEVQRHTQQQPDLWQCMCNKSLPDPVFPSSHESCRVRVRFSPSPGLPFLGSSLHFPPPPPPEEGGNFWAATCDDRDCCRYTLHYTAFCGARGREAPTALVNLHPPVETRTTNIAVLREVIPRLVLGAAFDTTLFR